MCRLLSFWLILLSAVLMATAVVTPQAVASAATSRVPERTLEEYIAQFPGTQSNLYSINDEPIIPRGHKGHAVLAPTLSRIYDQSEIPALGNNDTFLIVGSTWVLFDTTVEKFQEFASRVSQPEYPPPVVSTQNIVRLDPEHQSYSVHLKNGILGVNLLQVCDALLTSRKTSALTGEVSYQFENCKQEDDIRNTWIHQSFSGQVLVSKVFEGRSVTLLLYQNYTIIQRHRMGIVKPPKALMLSIARTAAEDGFAFIMKIIPVGRFRLNQR